MALLLLPAVPLGLLLGLHADESAPLLVGRVAGSALLGIGVASWLARRDGGGPARFGLLTGILIYDVVVALLLVDAGTGLVRAGPLLWPAVVAHLALAGWCVACLRGDRPSSGGRA